MEKMNSWAETYSANPVQSTGMAIPGAGTWLHVNNHELQKAQNRAARTRRKAAQNPPGSNYADAHTGHFRMQNTLPPEMEPMAGIERPD
jgi:hypothetical protein